METSKHCIDCMDSLATAQGLPTYTDLLAFAQRMAYPHAGDALILEDFRNISRNVVEPDGKRIRA